MGGHREAPGTILAPPKVNQSPVGIRRKIRRTLDFTASGRILTGHRPARDSKQPSSFLTQTAGIFRVLRNRALKGVSARATASVVVQELAVRLTADGCCRTAPTVT